MDTSKMQGSDKIPAFRRDMILAGYSVWQKTGEVSPADMAKAAAAFLKTMEDFKAKGR